jgi:hypothetical protein
VATGTLARDARELSIGNADLIVADGPIDRHYHPLVMNPAKPSPPVTKARA